MPKKKNLEGLVEEGWLHVTDDTVLDEGCADLVEVFWKMGFLGGMTVAHGLKEQDGYLLVEEAAKECEKTYPDWVIPERLRGSK
jgi:hypothetical protein